MCLDHSVILPFPFIFMEDSYCIIAMKRVLRIIIFRHCKLDSMSQDYFSDFKFHKCHVQKFAYGNPCRFSWTASQLCADKPPYNEGLHLSSSRKVGLPPCSPCLGLLILQYDGLQQSTDPKCLCAEQQVFSHNFSI